MVRESLVVVVPVVIVGLLCAFNVLRYLTINGTSCVRGRIRVAAAAVALVCLSGGSAALAGSGHDPRPLPDASAPVVAPSKGASPAGKLGDELPELRTRTSRTYVAEGQPSGRIARVFNSSVNFRDDRGAWRAIDNSLTATAGGFRNRANAFDAELPARLSEAVSVAEGGDEVSFTLRDAKGLAAKTSGARAAYQDVFPGVDVRYEALPDALKELVMLNSAQAQRSFVFDLNLSDGLRPKLASSGAIVIAGADGRQRMLIAAPYMVDAKGHRSHAVDYELLSIDGKWRLTLAARGDWLDAPDRAFPVAIDPTVFPYGEADCSLDEIYPSTSYCASDYMDVGKGGGTIHDHRALLRFDVDAAVPNDAKITNGVLGLVVRGQSGTQAKRVDIHRLTRSFTDGATWDNWDGSSAWTTPGGDFDPAVSCEFCPRIGGSSGSGYGDYMVGEEAYWGLRQLVSDWATGAKPNYGMLLRENPSETANNIFEFSSSEAAGQEPFLDVGYEQRLGQIRGHKYETQQLTDRLSLSVNASAGNLMLRARDLSVPGGIGPDLNVSRTYNSQQAGQLAYGQGWGMDTGPDVRVQHLGSRNVILHGPSGLRALFTRITETSSTTSYKTPVGFDATLSRNLVADQWTYTEHKSQRKLTFDSMGRLIKDEDRNNRSLAYTYVSGTFKLQKITDAQSRDTTFTYTGDRITQMTDAASRTYTYAYNGYGQLTSYTNPASGQTAFSYGPYGIELITSPAGRKTKITYLTYGANQGRVASVIRVTNPTAAFASMTGPTTQFAYTINQDGSGQGTVTDPNSNTVTSKYDTEGRPTEATDGRGVKTKSSYTANSNVLDFTTGANTGTTPNTTLTYDTANNLEGATTPTSSAACSSSPTTCIKSSSKHGTAGGISSGVLGHQYLKGEDTNPQGEVQTYTYDANGNPKTLSQNANTITLNYDAAKPGKLDNIVNERGKTTAYGYDTAGNMTSIDPPTAGWGTDLGTTGLTYTSSLSRIATVTDGKGSTRTLGYDNLDRVTSIAYPSGGTLSFVYDGDGNLTQQNDTISGRNTAYTYDQLSRITAETRAGTTTSYGYDPASNLTSLIDGSGTTTYGYDAANRNSSVREPGSSTSIQLGRDDDNNRTTTTYLNGVVVERKHDQAGRVEFVKATKGATVLRHQEHTYRYGTSDQEGAVRVRTIDHKTGQTTRYQYDLRGRLFRARSYTTASTPPLLTDSCATTAALRCHEYDHDATSNRVRSELTGSTVTATSTSYAYDDANRLCWKKSPAVLLPPGCSAPPTGATTYTYDANGNQLTRPAGASSRTMAYNPRDQLTSIDGTTMGFLGAGQDQPISQGTLTLKHNLLGFSARLNGTTTDYYTREADGTPLAQRTGTSTTTRQYYIADILGTITDTTDSAGNVQATYTYDPDGTTTATTGTSTSPLGYVSGYKAPAGLVHFGQRMYDPENARWTQQDPLDQTGDLTEGNRYGYVGGDPINNIDPSGEVLISLARVVYIGGRKVIQNPTVRTKTTNFVNQQVVRAEGAARGAAGVVDKVSDFITKGPF